MDQASVLDVLKNPMDLPPAFKNWLLKYIEVNPPSLPVSGMLGYQASPKVTAGAISDGPPADPKDGDIWIATGVDANGTCWQFRYNAGSSSAKKWEFIGGPPLTSDVNTSESTASTTFVDLATAGPLLTVPRDGDYRVKWMTGVAHNSSSGGSLVVGLLRNGFEQARVTGVGDGVVYHSVVREALTSWVAGDAIRMKYASTVGTATFGARSLTIVPLRIA